MSVEKKAIGEWAEGKERRRTYKKCNYVKKKGKKRKDGGIHKEIKEYDVNDWEETMIQEADFKKEELNND